MSTTEKTGRRGELLAVAGLCLVAFGVGRGTAERGSSSEAYASPPAAGFPVDAGAQRKEMIEELRRIRKALAAGRDAPG
jgi:hypothetical protein